MRPTHRRVEADTEAAVGQAEPELYILDGGFGVALVEASDRVEGLAPERTKAGPERVGVPALSTWTW